MKLLSAPCVGIDRDHPARQVTIVQDQPVLLTPHSHNDEGDLRILVEGLQGIREVLLRLHREIMEVLQHNKLLEVYLLERRDDIVGVLGIKLKTMGGRFLTLVADQLAAALCLTGCDNQPPAEKPPVYKVKVPLLDLSVAVLVLAVSGGVVSDDAQAVNRFSGALQKAFSEQTNNRIHRGRAVTKQKDKLVAIWGNTPLYLQHQIVAIATQKGAAGELADLVGPLPEPELPPAPKKPPEAMF
jgi:hypothetical protein